MFGVIDRRRKTDRPEDMQPYEKPYEDTMIGVAFLALLLALVVAMTVYHRFKPWSHHVHGPDRAYRVPVQRITFLKNLTWYEEGVRHTEQDIVTETIGLIEQARHRLILDIFLFNDVTPKQESFLPTVDLVTNALCQRKQALPGISGLFVTDPINTFYGTSTCRPLHALQGCGYEVVITNIDRLRDNNLLYAGLWRVFLGWLETGRRGILPNPIEPERHTTLRAVLKALNTRGNHRKVIIGDSSVIITSSNYDNKSSYFGDVGVRIDDPAVADYFAFTEYEVARMSGSDGEQASQTPEAPGIGDALVTPLLGQRIRKALATDIESTGNGDSIQVGMLFLSDRGIISRLEHAAKRGVKVCVVLDNNTFSFGKKKIGIPNRFLAYELFRRGVSVRWYNTVKEEFHTKLVYIRKQQRGVCHCGSANLTRRSLLGSNLETNVRIAAGCDSGLMQGVEAYLERITRAPYSVAYDGERPRPFLLPYWFARFQERTGTATF